MNQRGEEDGELFAGLRHLGRGEDLRAGANGGGVEGQEAADSELAESFARLLKADVVGQSLISYGRPEVPECQIDGRRRPATCARICCIASPITVTTLVLPDPFGPTSTVKGSSGIVTSASTR